MDEEKEIYGWQCRLIELNDIIARLESQRNYINETLQGLTQTTGSKGVKGK